MSLKENLNILKQLIFGLSYVLVTFFSIALTLYILANLKEKTIPDFELAIISIIFGGLMLSGSVFGKAAPDLQLRMRRIGATYLIAAVAFVIFIIFFSISGFLPSNYVPNKIEISRSIILDLPWVNFSINYQQISENIAGFSMMIGVIALSMAMWSMIILVIPRFLCRSRSSLI